MKRDLAATRVFVDVSHTFRSAENTGIQRVVRKLANLLPQLAEHGGVECELVIMRKGRFWSQPRGSRRLPVCSLDESKARFINCIPTILLPSGVADGHDDSGPRSWNINSGLLKTPFQAFWKWERYASKLQFSQEIDFRPGDVLVMPDGYWSLEEIWTAVSNAKEKGVQIASVVYDLICLTHPQFFPEKTRAAFERYIGCVLEQADFIATISNVVKRQLENLIGRTKPNNARPYVASFRLGADHHAMEGAIRPELRKIFDGESPYLMVATFEPRKNHQFVMKAFENLWHAGREEKILFAGTIGWQCSDVLEYIQNHPHLNKQVFALHDLTDAEIGFCYSAAKGVITASDTEGFGLPIVEGKRYGRNVLASDTEVHREVGREACTYFSLQDCAHLSAAIEYCEQLRSSGKYRDPEPSSVESWDDSAAEFLRNLFEFLPQKTGYEQSKRKVVAA